MIADEEQEWHNVQHAMVKERVVSDVIPIAPKGFIEVKEKKLTYNLVIYLIN